MVMWISRVSKEEFFYQRAGQVGLPLYLYNHITFHKANLIHFSIKIYYNHSNPSRGKGNIWILTSKSLIPLTFFLTEMVFLLIQILTLTRLETGMALRWLKKCFKIKCQQALSENARSSKLYVVPKIRNGHNFNYF